MNKTKEIAFNALRQMYQEAEPPLDFDDVLENPNEYGDDWYNNHYLDGDRQSEIVSEHCDGENLTGSQHTAILMTAILNYGPKSTPN